MNDMGRATSGFAARSEATTPERVSGRRPRDRANTNVTIARTGGVTYRVGSLFGAAHLSDRPPSPEERVPAPGVPDGGEGAI